MLLCSTLNALNLGERFEVGPSTDWCIYMCVCSHLLALQRKYTPQGLGIGVINQLTFLGGPKLWSVVLIASNTVQIS